MLLTIIYEVKSVTPLPLSTLESHDAEISPRKRILEGLAASGCTNKLIAHYIIDLAINPTLSQTAIVERMEGMTTASQADVTAWVTKAQDTITEINGG